MTKTEELKKTMVDILLNYPAKGIAVPVGKKADVILKACKDVGLAFVVEDAELPKKDFVYFPNANAKYKEAQQDMLNAGFRQTEEIDTREPR